MHELVITSVERRKFSMTEHGKELGLLTYNTLASFKADITLSAGSSYTVTKKGFFGPHIEVKSGDTLLLQYKYNWGKLIITTFFDDGERTFFFKRKGLFTNTYVLQDKEGQELASISPKFIWRKFRNDFTMMGNNIFRNREHNLLLFITCIHGANYFIRLRSSAAS